MMLQTIKNRALELHNDEQGDIPVGTVMVIGLIAIPLVIALMTFRDDVVLWLQESFETFKGNGI